MVAERNRGGARARARQKGERRETDALHRVQAIEILSFTHKIFPVFFGSDSVIVCRCLCFLKVDVSVVSVLVSFVSRIA